MKHYIYFSGDCEIEAKDEEEARRKFWDIVSENKPLPANIYYIDEIKISNLEDDD